MRYLLDTNVISDLVRNPSGMCAQRLAEAGADGVGTSVVVVGELVYGVRRKGSSRLAERVEAVLRRIEILPLSATVAQSYGEIRCDLERRGVPIGWNDLWIAAHALAERAMLVTANEGKFGRVPGLVVQNWRSA